MAELRLMREVGLSQICEYRSDQPTCVYLNCVPIRELPKCRIPHMDPDAIPDLLQGRCYRLPCWLACKLYAEGDVTIHLPDEITLGAIKRYVREQRSSSDCSLVRLPWEFYRLCKLFYLDNIILTPVFHWEVPEDGRYKFGGVAEDQTWESYRTFAYGLIAELVALREERIQKDTEAQQDKVYVRVRCIVAPFARVAQPQRLSTSFMIICVFRLCAYVCASVIV
eukprot:GHVS01023686.1.p1 GENE.GHVS01023686.1~~GHVS01023686.1.p1  ORF type:complete len:224 (-),score=3.91 GHVS01023686.1:314-985(-)